MHNFANKIIQITSLIFNVASMTSKISLTGTRGNHGDPNKIKLFVMESETRVGRFV